MNPAPPGRNDTLFMYRIGATAGCSGRLQPNQRQIQHIV
jgi:hypothetical protein